MVIYIFRNVIYVEGFQNEIFEIGEVEDCVDYFGFDIGEDMEIGDVGGVQVWLDGEVCDGGWMEDEGLVYFDVEIVDFGERFVVWISEGFEVCGGDFCCFVFVVEFMMKEQINFWNNKCVSNN